MRIGILVLATGRQAGGPETYEVELIRNLLRIDSENQYFAYCTNQSAVDAIGVRRDNLIYRVLKPSVRSISVGVVLPALLLKDRIDILHCTYAPPPFSTCPYLFTMHCTSNFEHPEFYPGNVRLRLNTLHRLGLRKAQSILCVSGQIKEYLQERFGIAEDRLAVIYNGASHKFRPVPLEEARRQVAEKWGIDYPYILFVGKIQARKNIIRLLHAFDQFRRATGSHARLVLAGKRVETSEGITETIQELGLQRLVVELGYVAPPALDPHSGLPSLYSGARMFVFPSLWEGFGIPVIEAMASGTPVVTSNASCLPEIAGDAAVIVDPLSCESIAEGMASIEASEDLRNQLIRRGLARAQSFTWERCARATLEAYRKAG